MILENDFNLFLNLINLIEYFWKHLNRELRTKNLQSLFKYIATRVMTDRKRQEVSERIYKEIA